MLNSCYHKIQFNTNLQHLIKYVLYTLIQDRHDTITKDILQLDPWENVWTVVAKQALMHDSYDVCLVANLNPRGLMPPPADLVEE